MRLGGIVHAGYELVNYLEGNWRWDGVRSYSDGREDWPWHERGGAGNDGEPGGGPAQAVA